MPKVARAKGYPRTGEDVIRIAEEFFEKKGTRKQEELVSGYMFATSPSLADLLIAYVFFVRGDMIVTCANRVSSGHRSSTAI